MSNSYKVEEMQNGNLIIDLPIGKYILPSRKDRSTTAIPVEINGELLNPNQWFKNYRFQAGFITYDDGSRSGFLGYYPIELEKVV